MQVFISWSGERSRTLAEALRAWLPRVLQATKPWMSDTDIAAGSRWLSEVSDVLDSSTIGIICVTPENLISPWLHFEEGALSKALDQSRICPIGYDMTPGQISGPLTQFQSVSFTKEGLCKVLVTLNRCQADQALPVTELDEIYEVWWPKLEEKIAGLPTSTEPSRKRSTEDQLEELLQNSREQLRRENLRLEASQTKDAKSEKMIELMENAMSSLNPMKSALSNLQAAFASASRSIAMDGNASDPADSAQAMQLVKLLGSSLPTLNPMGLDTTHLNKMVEFVKGLEQESKEHTRRLLKPPDGGDHAPPGT